MTVCVAVQTRYTGEVCALVLGACICDISHVSRASILRRYAAQKAGLPALCKIHGVTKIGSSRRLLVLVWDRWDLRKLWQLDSIRLGQER
jgi:hypothetical protein